MEKFLSIPVLDGNGTNSQNQLVSVAGILSIGQPTTTTATINYVGGKITTLTWPATYASPILQEAVQTAAMAALKSGWTSVSEYYAPKGMIAGAAVNTATETGSFLNINPLSAIAIA
jgi:hypothetical protein|tara:strand:+ start:9229 stop:9579 length:351 start_codon:yes stop_codon:yes gene_type:complete